MEFASSSSFNYNPVFILLVRVFIFQNGSYSPFSNISIRIICILIFIYLFIIYLLLFRAAPMAYGSSQARGWTRDAAAGLHHSHSNIRSKLHLQPTPQQYQIFNTLSEARDQTHILMNTIWLIMHWTAMGLLNLQILYFENLGGKTHTWEVKSTKIWGNQ